jgi:Family of unknown function (DUF5759)
MAWTSKGPNVPTLNPTDLFSKRKTRDTSRLKAYNQILEQIHTRILKASRELADPHILYTVPPFLLGLPRLDLEDCIVYVVYQLRQQAYMVRYTYPNLLFISWAHHEKEYMQKQSPITQAMTPLHAERKEQQSRVRFADEIRTNRPTQPTGTTKMLYGASTQAEPKSTTDYRPPTSFLDAIERPAVPLQQKKDVLDDLWSF